MLNLMRNVLLNLSATEQTTTVSPEFHELIPDSFSPLRYNPSVEAVRGILVSRSSPDKAAFDARMALVLAHSSELESYLRTIENVFTFSPQTRKHFNSGFTYDIVSVDRRYTNSPSQDAFLRAVRPTINTPVFRSLVRIHRVSDSAVTRAGVAVTLFLLHAASLLGAVTDG